MQIDKHPLPNELPLSAINAAFDIAERLPSLAVVALVLKLGERDRAMIDEMHAAKVRRDENSIISMINRL